jgi:hypothetical protein
MKFIQSRGGYIKWDHKRNEDILDKLKIKPLLIYIENFQRKWEENTGRLPKQLLCYQPRGQRSTEHPVKCEENARL